MEVSPIMVTKLVGVCVQVAWDDGRVTDQTDGYIMIKIDHNSKHLHLYTLVCFWTPTQVPGVAVVSSTCTCYIQEEVNRCAH